MYMLVMISSPMWRDRDAAPRDDAVRLYYYYYVYIYIYMHVHTK